MRCRITEHRPVGTTLTFRDVAPAVVSLILAGCLLMAAPAGTPHADPTQSKAFDLTKVLREIDQVLAKTAKTSTTYRLNGQYLQTDFDHRAFDWKSPGGIRLNPLSKPLRFLIYRAVCQQNGVALKKVFEVSNVIYGGLFNDFQRDYLQKLADDLALKLTFINPRQSAAHVSNSDLKWINQRRRLRAALDDDKLDQALRLLPALAMLCRNPN